MNLENDDDTNRDFDEMWFHHSGQLMTMRNASPSRAAGASLALMKRVFNDDAAFRQWLDRKEKSGALSTEDE